MRIAHGVIPILSAFREGADPKEVASRERDPVAAARAIERLERAGVLVPWRRTGRAAPGARERAAFADLEVHRRLLGCVRRVERFGAALERLVPGKVVVEIGTGTGVLAVLAARAGARRVIAIEETPVAEIAREVVRVNGVARRVRVVEAPSSEVALEPGGRGEVLVAELLGGDPFDEALVPVVLDARQRLLVPGARVIPRRLSVLVQGIEARDDRLDGSRRLLELDEVERALGVRLGPLRRRLASEGAPSFCAEVRGIEPGGGARLLTRPAALSEVDLEGPLDGVTRWAESFTRHVRLDVVEAGRLGAVAVFFRAELARDIELSNAPLAPETHWGQLILPLPAPRVVRPGERVPVAMCVHRGRLTILARR